MRAFVQADALKSAVRAVHAVVNRTHLIERMRCIRLRVSDGELEVYGCDDAATMKSVVELITWETGACLVAAHSLLATVASMTSDEIAIEVDPESGRLVVRGGRARLTIPLIEGVLFDVASPPDESMSEVDPAALREALGRVLPYVSTDATRPSLLGVHLAGVDGGWRATSASNHRVARITVSSPGPFPAAGVTVATAGAKAMLGALRDVESAQLAIGQSWIEARTPGARIQARLLGVAFPNVDVIIAPQTSKVATFDRRALLGAVKRCSLAVGVSDSEDGAKDSRALGAITFLVSKTGCLLHASDDSRSVSGDDAVAGESNEKMRAKLVAGYVNQALRGARGDAVTLTCNGNDDDGTGVARNMGPVLIKGDGDNLVVAIMTQR